MPERPSNISGIGNEIGGNVVARIGKPIRQKYA
jgi:hypothetical protein